MEPIQTWEDYLQRVEPLNEAAEEKPSENAGEQIQPNYTKTEMYNKLQAFLKGNSKPDKVMPQHVAKESVDWYVVDAAHRTFWAKAGWSSNPDDLGVAALKSEDTAHALAQAVGGEVVSSIEFAS